MYRLVLTARGLAVALGLLVLVLGGEAELVDARLVNGVQIALENKINESHNFDGKLNSAKSENHNPRSGELSLFFMKKLKLKSTSD